MTPAQQDAIANFFEAVTVLEKLEIIRSSRFLGDIGEFLCKTAFGVTLSDQLRQTGHDGTDENGRVQIKFNNSTKGNNISVGDPKEYEALVVVIGPNSKLREKDHGPHEFRLYRFTSDDVLPWKGQGNKYYCAKTQLAGCSTKTSLSTNSKPSIENI